jgi:hypothetical protein
MLNGKGNQTNHRNSIQKLKIIEDYDEEEMPIAEIQNWKRLESICKYFSFILHIFGILC